MFLESGRRRNRGNRLMARTRGHRNDIYTDIVTIRFDVRP